MEGCEKGVVGEGENGKGGSEREKKRRKKKQHSPLFAPRAASTRTDYYVVLPAHRQPPRQPGTRERERKGGGGGGGRACGVSGSLTPLPPPSLSLQVLVEGLANRCAASGDGGGETRARGRARTECGEGRRRGAGAGGGGGGFTFSRPLSRAHTRVLACCAGRGARISGVGETGAGRGRESKKHRPPPPPPPRPLPKPHLPTLRRPLQRGRRRAGQEVGRQAGGAGQERDRVCGDVQAGGGERAGGGVQAGGGQGRRSVRERARKGSCFFLCRRKTGRGRAAGVGAKAPCFDSFFFPLSSGSSLCSFPPPFCFCFVNTHTVSIVFGAQRRV